MCPPRARSNGAKEGTLRAVRAQGQLCWGGTQLESIPLAEHASGRRPLRGADEESQCGGAIARSVRRFTDTYVTSLAYAARRVAGEHASVTQPTDMPSSS